ELTYCNAPEGPEKFKAELGLDARLFIAGNTQAYVATDDNHIVVAFRGTESPTSLEGLKDWLLTDANNYLILPEGQIGTDYAAAGAEGPRPGRRGRGRPLPPRLHARAGRHLGAGLHRRGGRGEEEGTPAVGDGPQPRRRPGPVGSLAIPAPDDGCLPGLHVWR